MLQYPRQDLLIRAVGTGSKSDDFSMKTTPRHEAQLVMSLLFSLCISTVQQRKNKTHEQSGYFLFVSFSDVCQNTAIIKLVIVLCFLWPINDRLQTLIIISII